MFKPGYTVMTHSIASTMDEARGFRGEVMRAFSRYKSMDWGDASPDSKLLNDEAVENGKDRILAVYPTNQGKIWIITDWEDNAPHTTIMFPSDY